MSRKSKDLDSLLRLQGWAVDERRRELGILLGREDDLVRQGEEMDRRLIAEQKVARADPTFAGHAYARYAELHLRRKEQLAHLQAQLRVQIDAARDTLAEAYRDQKVLEEVQKERRKQEKIEAARQEQAFFDEVAQTRFIRRQE